MIIPVNGDILIKCSKHLQIQHKIIPCLNGTVSFPSACLNVYKIQLTFHLYLSGTSEVFNVGQLMKPFSGSWIIHTLSYLTSLHFFECNGMVGNMTNQTGIQTKTSPESLVKCTTTSPVLYLRLKLLDCHTFDIDL